MSKPNSADRVAAARAAIDHISVDDAKPLVGGDSHLFVDVRERHEVEAGKIPGAVHAARGSLEFTLDPQSGMAIDDLVTDKTMIVVCGSGGRAAFATQLAQEFGYKAVCLEGGMKAWRAADGAVE